MAFKIQTEKFSLHQTSYVPCYVQNMTNFAATGLVLSSLLTIIRVQETQKSIQQVSDDGPQLFCG